MTIFLGGSYLMFSTQPSLRNIVVYGVATAFNLVYEVQIFFYRFSLALSA